MRVALAGYAYARTIHAPVLREAGAQVVLVATADPGRAAQARTDWPGTVVVADLVALLATAPALGVDVVVLVTPTGSHAEHVRAVLAAGLPCVVDKPLACDAATAAALVAQARAARVPLTVFQNRRYDEGPRALAALQAAGELGTVRRVELRYERWRPEPKRRWREQTPWQQGGGILLDLASHDVDAAVRVLGPVASVAAVVESVSTVADDDAVLLCRHAAGGASVLWVSSVEPAPGPRMRVIGTRAAYLLDEFDGDCWYPDLGNAPGSAGWLVAGQDRRPVPRPRGGQADFYRALAAALAAGPAGPRGYLARQAAMPVDPADAVHTLAIIDAARISAVQSREVAVTRHL